MSELPASGLFNDLSRLAAPAFVLPLSFETILADRVADFRTRWPDHTALLESDPVMKLLETGAYRELLVRAAINDSGRSVMLAYARGSDLDHITARVGVTRLVITPATGDAPAVLEDDESLRRRAQLAPEAFAAPGLTAGSYTKRALDAAPEVKNVAILARPGGHVDVVLLARAGDGTVSTPVLERVWAALNGEGAAQLTDIVSVRSASVTTYAATVTLTIRPGPDPELVRTAAEASVRAFAAQRHRIGLPVYAVMLASAAAVGSVEHAQADIADIIPGADGAAQLGALTILVEVLR